MDGVKQLLMSGSIPLLLMEAYDELVGAHVTQGNQDQVTLDPGYRRTMCSFESLRRHSRPCFQVKLLGKRLPRKVRSGFFNWISLAPSSVCN